MEKSESCEGPGREKELITQRGEVNWEPQHRRGSAAYTGRPSWFWLILALIWAKVCSMQLLFYRSCTHFPPSLLGAQKRCLVGRLFTGDGVVERHALGQLKDYAPHTFPLVFAREDSNSPALVQEPGCCTACSSGWVTHRDTLLPVPVCSMHTFPVLRNLWRMEKLILYPNPWCSFLLGRGKGGSEIHTSTPRKEEIP